MAEFKFECPCCKQHLQADTEWIGQIAKCPACDTAVKIEMKKLQLKKTETQSIQNKLCRCQTCGKSISTQARICPNCGAPNAIYINQKSAWIYAILWLIGGIWGLHNIYSGHTIRAVGKILFFVIAYVITGYRDQNGNLTTITICAIFGILILFAWSIIEVASTTKDANGIPFR